jgi:uncharacterized protein
MISIGVLSDTHGYLDNRLLELFSSCDEIWHAGDIGGTELVDKLEQSKPCRMVYGNIDDRDTRIRTASLLNFEVEGIKVIIHHYGGQPGKYDHRIAPVLQMERPQLFICGHSHILRVVRDPSLDNMLFVNPGAAGNHGFHKVRTAVRFKIHEGKIFDFEAIELGSRGDTKVD